MACGSTLMARKIEEDQEWSILIVATMSDELIILRV
jgi:hypothetical protein